jgi:outer membrane biosynthesis protein TonB
MPMKTILSTTLALAIAGSPLLAGQEPETEKDKQKQEQPKKQPPKPQPRPNPEPQSEDQPQPKPDKPKQKPAPPPKEKQDQKQEQQTQKERQKQQEKQQKEQAKENPKTQQQQHPTADSSRQTPQRAQGKGQKIPQEKFRANFGREHRFRLARRDDRRFQYGGYWFEVVEVWPAGWSFDDECYIEEDGDDYYLVDILHPEIRVFVIVVG